MTRRLVAFVAVIVVVATGTVLALRTGGDDPDSETDPVGAAPALVPAEAARRFLDDFVDDDGRVVRRDQGGDTVSEGQAYALLLATAVDDREQFDAVWAWTEDNLLRDDGLLAWHWVDGEVVDPQPATDADLDAARALVLAADRFDEPRYARLGTDLADAIIEHETVEVAGDRVLLAGPWAATAPYVVNPSYTSPQTYALLGAATGDPSWAQLRESGYAQLRSLTGGGARLPSDWAAVSTRGAIAATGPPGGGEGEVTYSYDAFRTVLRLAEACDQTGPELAASLRPLTDRTTEEQGERHHLDGTVASAGTNPPLLIAAASARAAAGADGVDDLLTRAATAAQEQSSYYLSAWVALGGLLLDGGLGGCGGAARSGGSGTATTTAPPTTPPPTPDEGTSATGEPTCTAPRPPAQGVVPGADLFGADLRCTDLGGADLSGADLTDADLRETDLTDADLRGATLGGADLRAARLEGAQLGGSDLRSADLRSADLTGADLTNADLSGARMAGADLTGARTTGATWTGATCPDGTTTTAACPA